MISGRGTNMINFTEWDQRKTRNQQTRSDFATIKAHVTTAQDAQDGLYRVEGDEVVVIPAGEHRSAGERRIFTVIGGLVYPA